MRMHTVSHLHSPQYDVVKGGCLFVIRMNCCDDALSGNVITPCSENYEKARQEWNRAIQKFPLAIIYCSTSEEISKAICWARRHCIGIRIRSGGHNYEGYSTGNNILVIDVSPMQRLVLNEEANTLFIQSGVTNNQLYDYMGALGYPFPGGTCPTVGVAGYTLGGGWGYSSRYMGLGCDSLIELEMVDYQGTVLTANADTNSDLFWACRGGGGGNFGVVTSMTFELPAKVDTVTLIELAYSNTSQDTMIQFLGTWQTWLVNLDDRMTINASLYNSADDGMGIYGRGLFYGSAAAAELILQPFTEIEGASLTLEELTFWEAIQKIGATYPDSEKFQSTGRFVERQYDADELENIVELISQRAEGSVFAAVSVYALGGKVQTIDAADTAFYYRNAAYILSIQSVWEDNRYLPVNRPWLYEQFRYLRQITTGSYVNFPYSYIAAYESAYYGENVTKLRQINRQYDPQNIFCFPQSIR